MKLSTVSRFGEFFFIVILLIFISVLLSIYRNNTEDSYMNQAIKTCKSISYRETEKCWGEAMEKIIKKEGLESGFKFFRKFYLEDGVGDCHPYAHILGRSAYNAFIEGRQIVESDGMKYCGYGFWHGFMERYVAVEGMDADNIKNFCNKFSPDFINDCFHGVGIGGIGDPPPFDTWGKPQEMAERALKLCDTTAKPGRQLTECISGVFHQQGLFAYRNEYGMVFDKKKPLSLCDPYLNTHYEGGCIWQISSWLPDAFDRDLSNVYEYVADNYEEEPIHEMITMSSKVISIYRIQENDYSSFIIKCKSIPISYQKDCISGYVYGMFEVGEPEKEYVKAIDFCKSSELSKEDKGNCVNAIIMESSRYYKSEKKELVCSVIDRELNIQCQI